MQRIRELEIDSWGSELPKNEINKGISLVFCQTEKGKELLCNTTLILKPVDIDKAIDANRQLKGPMKLPEERETFFKSLENGSSFSSAVHKAYPKMSIKQTVKSMLGGFGLLSTQNENQYGIWIKP